MKYLLDTDVLIDFFKKKSDLVLLLKGFRQSEGLAVSILTMCELRSGWNELEAKYFFERLYGMCSIEGVNLQIVELAGYWREKYARRGMKLSLVDTVLAATAFLNGYKLVTRNIRHFPMEELSLYKHE